MKKAVIIGAGPAGLTAGYELLKQSGEYEVTILEESSVVGGISRTVVHNGNRMDIGGHRFFSKDPRVNKWWDNMLPRQGEPSYDDKVLHRDVPLMPAGPDPEKTDEVMLNRRRVSRIYFDGKFVDYPIKMNSKTLKTLGMGETWKAGFSYLGGSIVKRQEKSLEDFYINRFGRKLYEMFFEGYTEKLWGRHPRDISPDWGAQRAKGLSVGAILKDVKNKAVNKNNEDVETSLIERFTYPKHGPGQLWEKVADEFMALGGNIHFNCCVNKVKTEGNKVLGVSCLLDNDEIFVPADIVISSMPVKDLVGGMQNVPREVAEIAYGLPYRDFVTVGLLLPKLNISNETDMKTLNNILPDCWIYVQDSKIKLGRIQIFNNWSPYMVANPEETIWVGLEYFCSEGDFYWNMTEQQWLKQAVSDLTKMKMISSDTPILDYHKESVKKAYPAYFDTYERMDEVVKFLNGFTNLYCIGRNGQHRYNNMDHSMVTAFETVDCILKHKTDKSAIWNVNTEESYIEEKQTNVNKALISSDEKKKQINAPVTPAKKEAPVKPAMSSAPVPPARPAMSAPVPPVKTAPVPVAPSPEAPAGPAISAPVTPDSSVDAPAASAVLSHPTSAPAEEEVRPLPRRLKRRYPVPTKEQYSEHTPSVFATPSEPVRMPENVEAAKEEFLQDEIVARNIIKKAPPSLNKDAENYGVLQDASATSLVLEKSSVIDKSQEEVLAQNTAFEDVSKEAKALGAYDESTVILRENSMYEEDVLAKEAQIKEAAVKETEPKEDAWEFDSNLPENKSEELSSLKAEEEEEERKKAERELAAQESRKKWEEHLEEVRKQEERAKEIKNIIANGKVIKSTTIRANSEEKKKAPEKKKAESVKDNGKVIAVIRNGVTIPVDLAADPVTSVSKTKEGFIENPIVKEITIVNEESVEVIPKKRGRKPKTIQAENGNS